MICPNCQQPVEDGAAFCPNCGTPCEASAPQKMVIRSYYRLGTQPVQPGEASAATQVQAPDAQPVYQPIQQPYSYPAPMNTAPPAAAAPKSKKKLVIVLSIAAALIIAGIILLIVLLGKDSDDKTKSTDSGSTEATLSDVTEPTEPVTKKPAAAFKAGLIALRGEEYTGEKNYIDAFKAACAELGVECIIKTNVSETDDCYLEATIMAEDGCGFIFGDAFGHETFLVKAAGEYPDVQFAHASGYQARVAGLDNYHNAYASIYEGRYLAGVAAGMKLNEMISSGVITENETKIGYVASYAYAEVISDYTAFFLGARSVCPSAAMEVKFTGSWYSVTAEYDAAVALIQDKCVLISQHSDSLGAPNACEDADVPNIAYNGSTVSACPDTFIISSQIDWKPYFLYAIQAAMNGLSIDTDWIGTLATGSVVLSEVNDQAAAPGTAAKLEEVKAALESGSLHVFDTNTFTVGGKKLSNYMADVDSDDMYEPDTEAISDGYFHECEYRSAPYFDVQIDGIKLLNEVY